MADSTTNLDTISSGQSAKEVTANDLFDAGSPATLLGRRPSTTAGLTWGYYGGVAVLNDGTSLQIANGTKTLTNSATNYLELDTSDGSVDVNTSGWSAGKRRLYSIVVAGGAVSSYIDWRSVMQLPASGVTAAEVSIADTGGNFTSSDVEGALAELADAISGAGTGSVTSVDLAMPAEFSVSGNPVTTSGTLTVTKANQAANVVYAGPSSGGAAAPGFRALAAADIPTLTAAKVSDFSEAVDDRVASLIIGSGLTVTYDDSANTLTIALPAQPFDVTGFYPGIPTASAKVLRAPIARAVTFPANFANSVGKASANATGSTAFDLQKNGSSVGTMTYAAGASSATFTSSGGSAVSFAAGDVLAVIAPATPDATLADVGLVLAGTR